MLQVLLKTTADCEQNSLVAQWHDLLDVTDNVHSAREQALSFLVVQAMYKLSGVVSVGVTVPVKCTLWICIIGPQL